MHYKIECLKLKKNFFDKKASEHNVQSQFLHATEEKDLCTVVGTRTVLCLKKM